MSIALKSLCSTKKILGDRVILPNSEMQMICVFGGANLTKRLSCLLIYTYFVLNGCLQCKLDMQ